MAATITEPPDGEPVSLDEAKAQLRVDTDDSNALITRLIVTARQLVERQTNRSLMLRTIRLDLDGFPPGRGQIRLPFGPVTEVESVSYIDGNVGPTSIAESDYILDITPDVPTLTPVWTASWPCIARRPGAVSVTYVAGYENVPEEAKHAILLLVGLWFEHRATAEEAQTFSLPWAADVLISGLRIAQLS